MLSKNKKLCLIGDDSGVVFIIITSYYEFYDVLRILRQYHKSRDGLGLRALKWLELKGD